MSIAAPALHPYRFSRAESPARKMRAHMRDGRIPNAWRIDIPNRCVQLREPSNIDDPMAILRAADAFGFEGVTFTVNDTFAIFGPLNDR